MNSSVCASSDFFVKKRLFYDYLQGCIGTYTGHNNIYKEMRIAHKKN